MNTYTFYGTFDMNDDTLACVIAELICSNGVSNIPHPMLDPDEFSKVVDICVQSRIQEYGQNGLNTWCEDTTPMDFAMAEAFLVGACIDTDSILEYI